MIRSFRSAVAALLLTTLPALTADPSKVAPKTATSDPPKQLAEPVRALLSNKTVQLFEGDKSVCEIWFRKELAVKATPEEIQKGLNYRKLEESTIFGAIRLDQPWNSFRKQNLKPGVYTLRLGFQPMDGDHQGTAPFNEFLLLCPAADDKKAETMAHKDLAELSGKSIPGGSHPAVLLLYPNPKPEEAPKLVNKGSGIFVLNWKEDVNAGSQKAVLGMGMTMYGATMAE